MEELISKIVECETAQQEKKPYPSEPNPSFPHRKPFLGKIEQKKCQKNEAHRVCC
jgi:hypothetical protein